MPYPYGMQNSPAVGNGLGGLPRRATAVAAATVSSPVLQRTGSYFTFQTASSDVSTAYSGRILGDSAGRVIFKYQWNNGVQQYALGGCNYSDSGVTSTLTSGSITSGLWNSFWYSNSWSSGDSVYFYDLTNIYRIYVSGSSVTYATAKTAPIATTGTLTVGGSSYSIYTSFTQGVIGDSSSICPMTKMSNGQVLYTAVANIGATDQWIVGFVLDSSFNLVRSFPIVQLYSTTTTIHRRLLVLPVSGATDTFTVYGMAAVSVPSLKHSAATFNAATGSVTTSKQFTSSITDQNALSAYTSFLLTPSALFIFWNDASNTYTYRVSVPVNSDGSINATSIQQNVLAYAAIPMYDRYYDAQYNDYVGINSSPSLLDGASYSYGASSYVSVVNYLSSGTYIGTASISASSFNSKCIMVSESEDTSIADIGYGPQPLVRVGEKAFIGWYRDTNSSIPQYKGNVQLFKAT